MNRLTDLKEKILDRYLINKEEALSLLNQPLEELTKAADELREHFCGDKFDLCSIINAKSGLCSEDCKFCAQSSFYNTEAEQYKLLEKEEIIKLAEHNAAKGVSRFSLVTSGKKVSDKEVEQLCEITKLILSKTSLKICVSVGLLNEAQFKKLKAAGVVRVHNNLETSKNNFANVCSTHTFEDKVESITAAQKAGLEICSGGIMGLGETMEDRIDMAFSLRELNIDSVPVNFLNPIPGTLFENNKIVSNEEAQRIIAIYRFIHPKSFIRLAGGRELLGDKEAACFKSGANAAISGDMLTTTGITIISDIAALTELGFDTAS